MKVYLALAGRRVRVCVPYAGCPHVLAPGTCPHCGAGEKDAAPATGPVFQVSGGDPTRKSDRYVAVATCCACKAHVGRLEAVFETIFGLEEDERMTGPGARWRVY